MIARFTYVSKNYYLLYLMIKGICHSYQDYAQTSVCMFTVAMETLTNMAKMPFFIFFDIFLLFLELLIKISILHHTRTNT